MIAGDLKRTGELPDLRGMKLYLLSADELVVLQGDESVGLGQEDIDSGGGLTMGDGQEGALQLIVGRSAHVVLSF